MFGSVSQQKVALAASSEVTHSSEVEVEVVDVAKFVCVECSEECVKSSRKVSDIASGISGVKSS